MEQQEQELVGNTSREEGKRKEEQQEERTLEREDEREQQKKEDAAPVDLVGKGVVILLRGGFKLGGIILETNAENHSMTLENVIFFGRWQLIRARDLVVIPGFLVIDLLVGNLSDIIKKLENTSSLMDQLPHENEKRETELPRTLPTDEESKKQFLQHFSNGKLYNIKLIDDHVSMASMLKDLKSPKTKTIAIDCEGINLGKEGQLTLIQIATKKVVYIVDVLTLGNEVFEESLKDILESERILKILFDCRKDSDALYHLYNVKLKNVFDCQVADIIIRRNFTGVMPTYVRGMSKVMIAYFNFSEDDLEYKSAGKLLMEDPDIWGKRPLLPALVDYAAFDVAFLHALKDLMTELLNFELNMAMEKYLSVVRDENFDSGHIIPEFQSDILRHMFRDLRLTYQQRPIPTRAAINNSATNSSSPAIAPPTATQSEAAVTAEAVTKEAEAIASAVATTLE